MKLFLFFLSPSFFPLFFIYNIFILFILYEEQVTSRRRVCPLSRREDEIKFRETLEGTAQHPVVGRRTDNNPGEAKGLMIWSRLREMVGDANRKRHIAHRYGCDRYIACTRPR